MDEPKEKPAEPPKVEVVKDAPPPSSEAKNLVLVRQILPPQLPVLPLNNRPLFPRMSVPLVIENEHLRKMLVETAKSQSKFVGLVLKRHKENGDGDNAVKGADLHDVGVVAEILQVAQIAPNAPIQVLIGAMERFRPTPTQDGGRSLRALASMDRLSGL